MKKLAILILCMIPLMVFSQRRSPTRDYYKAFDMSTIVAADTVIWYEDDNKKNPFEIFGGYIGVEVDYHAVDDTTATIDVGVSDNGYSFNTLLTTPHIMNNSADSANVNGAIKGQTPGYHTTQGILDQVPTPFKYLPIKIVKNTVTSGIIKIWIKQYE